MKSVLSFASLRGVLRVLVPLVVALLAACGGGGGSSDPAPGPAPATITSQPGSASVVTGGAASFTVVATGAGIGYQWQRNTNGAPATWVNLPGATAATYTVAPVDQTMTNYQYRVVVAGTANTVTSSAATLTVTPLPTPPVVTAPPANQSVTAGANASFSVTATGTSLAYRWQSSADNSTWANVSGTSSTLTLNAVALADNGKYYRVVVSNTLGSVNSDSALLTVVAAAPPPVITSQPMPATAVAPQTATFTVVASSSLALSYQWQQATNGAGPFTDIASAVGASYTTPATAVGDAVKYFRVRVSTSSSSVTSNYAWLTVVATPSAPLITSQSPDVTLLAPGAATFTANASGAPTPTYQWQLSTDTGTTFLNINGAASGTYTIPATTLANNNTQLRAVASNSEGSATSHPAVLKVIHPGTGGFNAGVAVAGNGDIFVSVVPDTVGFVSTFRNATFYGIRKISAAGVVSTLAGSNTRGAVNGTGTAASFYYPYGIAVDADGNVYVADSSASMIRKITPAGVVTTLAGGDLQGGFVNGNGTQASFRSPTAVAVDGGGNVYVADTGNNAIRKITPAGDVTTLAGAALGGFADGTGTAAKFNKPYGVAVDGAGNVYVSDSYNHAIRKITPAGVVTTLAGGATSGLLDGTGSTAQFKFPGGVAVDGSGNVFVADSNNHAIRKVTPAGVVTTLAGGTPNDSLANSIAVDGGGNLYMDSNYGFPNAPYQIRVIAPTGVVTSLPGCCYAAP